MSYLTVSRLVHRADEVSSELDLVRAESSRGARLVEWRLDGLEPGDSALRAAERLCRDSPLPCIVTCRDASEGGLYEGPASWRWSLYRHVVGLDDPPPYVDIEAAAWLSDPAGAASLREAMSARAASGDGERLTSLVLSLHDFDGRPSDLYRRLQEVVAGGGADVLKVAWMARSLRDNLEAFELLRTRQLPMVVQCMGPFGEMSRVLTGKFGGMWSYAQADDDAEGEGATAPGQVSVSAMSEVYRFDSIGRATRVYGIIGWPVAHSEGPRLHNAAFAAAGVDARYVYLPVAPGYEPLKATLGAMLDDSGLDFGGASVTLPHKEDLARLLREWGADLDAFAERAGAVNTVVVERDGRVRGLNTDAAASARLMREALARRGVAMSSARVAVIGAGGVASAVLAACASEAASVTVFNRTRDRAAALVERFGAGDRVRVGSGEGTPEEFDLVVQATSVGMSGGPAPESNPLELLGMSASSILASGPVVYETVYTPVETPLVRAAREAGASVVTGLDLFFEQAADQFRAWTGEALPEEARSSFAG